MTKLSQCTFPKGDCGMFSGTTKLSGYSGYNHSNQPISNYLNSDYCCRCAMALLHSRIRKVFYLHPNPFCGALGSKYKLHVQQELNHHFEVYEGSRTEITLRCMEQRS